MNWNAIVEKVQPYVVKIETPRGHGTGFLCLYNQAKTFFGIATSRHVVGYADEWQQPIRLQHFPSSTSLFLKEGDRTILSDQDTDSAVILAHPGELQLPENTIPLLPTSSLLNIGTEVGWLGFPALASTTLCFFSGIISARQEYRHAYLIDGVSINGVSGGPVIYGTEADGVQIVGTVSAYISNRATGDTLPGLSIARDVSHFHDTITMLQTLDEAKEKKQELAEEKQAKSEPTPSTETPPEPPPTKTECEA
jgi:hypothetical protein